MLTVDFFKKAFYNVIVKFCVYVKSVNSYHILQNTLNACFQGKGQLPSNGQRTIKSISVKKTASCSRPFLEKYALQTP